MADCGDSYAHLLRTASGKGPQDFSETPAWALLTGEYDEAKAVADKIAGEVRKRWLRVEDLQRSAENLANGGVPLAQLLQALPAEMAAYWAANGELPWTTWTAPLTSDVALVQAAWDSAREGTCVMERLDAAIVLMGGVPPPSTKPPQTPPTSWWDGLIAATVGAGVVVLLGYGIYWGIKRKGMKQIAGGD